MEQHQRQSLLGIFAGFENKLIIIFQTTNIQVTRLGRQFIEGIKWNPPIKIVFQLNGRLPKLKADEIKYLIDHFPKFIYLYRLICHFFAHISEARVSTFGTEMGSDTIFSEELVVAVSGKNGLAVVAALDDVLRLAGDDVAGQAGQGDLL